MDWKLALATFVTVFVSELGDKTQIAALTLTASTRKPWIVFTFAALALILSTLVAVAVGTALAHVISPPVLRRAGAVLLVVLGVVLFLKEM